MDSNDQGDLASGFTELCSCAEYFRFVPRIAHCQCKHSIILYLGPLTCIANQDNYNASTLGAQKMTCLVKHCLRITTRLVHPSCNSKPITDKLDARALVHYWCQNCLKHGTFKTTPGRGKPLHIIYGAVCICINQRHWRTRCKCCCRASHHSFDTFFAAAAQNVCLHTLLIISLASSFPRCKRNLRERSLMMQYAAGMWHYFMLGPYAPAQIIAAGVPKVSDLRYRHCMKKCRREALEKQNTQVLA